jgi:aspartyl-tRNA(Asn)/glutamyl-tRNA(Gln) amidotransferase subunit A
MYCSARTLPTFFPLPTRVGMIDLNTLTVSKASDALDSKTFSSVELIEATLKRIEETEPFVHAFAHVTAARALEEAHVADREPRRGPLHGIPFAVKDVLETRDVPTEAGSRVLAGFVPLRDATAVRRLRDAGAILIGKHVTHEFATGQNVPPTRNAWNLGHYPGGSSAGGGVSVAVGSSLMALGSDMGGSIRKPAALNGVVGLKPTYGRVSASGTVRGASIPSVEHVGTFTRTVEDTALVLGAIAGYDPADARTFRDSIRSYLFEIRAGVEGVRLGVPREEPFGPPPDPELKTLAEAALAELERLGAILVEVGLPSMRLALPAASTIMTAEAAVAHREWLRDRPDDYTDETRRFLELGLISPPAQLQAAYRAQSALRADVHALFREAHLHALVMPTMACTAMPIEELVVARDMPRLIQYTCPWSLIGQPALSIPCGFTSPGLPAGLQIIGRPFDESMVLRIGYTYQQATGWHNVRPPVAEPGTAREVTAG